MNKGNITGLISPKNSTNKNQIHSFSRTSRNDSTNSLQDSKIFSKKNKVYLP
jgi:hypothetical protein